MLTSMYSVVFSIHAKKEFLRLDKKAQELISTKLLDLQNGIFTNDKALKGKHNGKFRKRAGNYRIIYLKENDILLITLIRIAHRKEVY